MADPSGRDPSELGSRLRASGARTSIRLRARLATARARVGRSRLWTSRPARWVRRHWALTALGVLLVLLLSTWLWTATCGYEGCPSVAEMQRFRPTEGSRVLDRSGE